MTAAAFFELFHQYGLFLVCGVIFCEYMNLPGFPAGVIMPCIGVLIAQSSLSLPLTLVLSVASGLLGSLVIYGLCYWADHGKAVRKEQEIPLVRTEMP